MVVEVTTVLWNLQFALNFLSKKNPYSNKQLFVLVRRFCDKYLSNFMCTFCENEQVVCCDFYGIGYFCNRKLKCAVKYVLHGIVQTYFFCMVHSLV